MRFEEWEPYYLEILRDFGYSRERDEEAARLLDSLIAGRLVEDAELARLLGGRWVTVAGNAPSLAGEIDRAQGVVIAADEATSAFTARGEDPQVIVTDLDGDVADQVAANRRGAIAVIHAHGDNMPALRRWVPEFTGPVVGTTQSTPSGRLRNYGGFTDGDRGVLLAQHFTAERVSLVGFDFEHPNPKDSDGATKKRKLDWAFILVNAVLDLG
ncbi:MAG TPA: 6-hydroxymethylpterin diphosphokinase MptE-like protein [Thermoplasmata archaeon]|nr:6-hydroxymethylpterin diphosphokinase MptE-like protein [Thermoplasmata archaeon]